MLPPVVWVTTEIAVATPRSGGQLRTQRLVEHLAANTEVTVVAVQGATDPDVVGALTGASRVVAFDRRGALGTRIVAAARRWPRPVAQASVRGATAEVAARAAAGAVVVIDHASSLAHVPPTGPYVVNLHNVESRRLAEHPATSGSRAALELRRDARRYRALEERVGRDRRATLVTVSPDEASLLVGGAIAVVPNGTDLPPTVPALPPRGAPLFIGALDYAPNLLALRWWIDEVWPLLPSASPPLSVVGRNEHLVRAPMSTHEGIRLLGAVDDVGPHLAAAGCVVVPLQHGGGTRLKVLEALAWGRPLVTTSKGAEGVPLVDGVDALVADTPAAFASAVVSVSRDRALAARLSTGGRALAHDYAWPMLARRFEEIVGGLR